MSNPRQALKKLLASLSESAQFATSGSLPSILPGLEVADLGPIGIPVSPHDAKRLIAAASQAPYGRGEETIVDTNVRRVWQIEPGKFALRNDAWEPHLEAIVKAVIREFGLQQKVTADLYKLLIYEEGSFFAPHRDTEKVPGMFATLVVCLPSQHEGGTLIVQHDAQTKSIDFGGPSSAFQTQYAAFYADCQHEITPVTSGYRVCLIYNLAATGKKNQPSAPQTTAAVEQARALLGEIFAETAADLSRIAIPLVHQYTEANLDPAHLKGADRTTTEVVFRAAEALNYQCYLALLTHKQTGGTDYWGGDDYYSRRRRRWGYHDEESEVDASGLKMTDVLEDNLTLDHWLDSQGRMQPFKEMKFASEELLAPEEMEGWKYKQTVHEATGNEGATLERWYHQAVLVLWPSHRFHSLLAREGPLVAVPALEDLAQRCKSPEDRSVCEAFLGEIIHRWKSPHIYRTQDAALSRRMLILMEAFGTTVLAQEFVSKILPGLLEGTEGPALLRVCERLGWTAFAAPLREIATQPNSEVSRIPLVPIVSICESLCCDPPAWTEERRAVCGTLAEGIAGLVKRVDAPQKQPWLANPTRRTGLVAKLAHIFAVASSDAHLTWLADHVLATPAIYDLHQVLIPDVKALAQWLPSVPVARPVAQRLLDHCLGELRTATREPVEPPQDWRRNDQTGCKCEDCRMLATFLRDPTKQIGRFPLCKERMQHLHDQINRNQLDLTHITERVGSPQTLVCTKTQASYERRLQQLHTDQKLLAELEALTLGASEDAGKKVPKRRKKKS